MLAKDLISNAIPFVRLRDMAKDVLNNMAIFKVSHLPVVEGNEFYGLVSESDIYSRHDNTSRIERYKNSFHKVSVNDCRHVYDVISIVSKNKLSLIPVVDDRNCYVGSITALGLAHYFSSLIGSDEQSTVIIIEINYNDYVLTEIAQIIENNDAKILSLNVVNQDLTSNLDVIIKLNTLNLTPILNTFERYEYQVKSTFIGNNLSDSFYDERLDELINYLNV